MVFQRLRTIGSLLQRIFVKKPNKASNKKSIRYQLRHMLTEDAITKQPEEKGTHGFGDTVNPMPFKMNIGIYLSFLVIWIGIWTGDRLAHYGVSLLGDIIVDEDGDEDDDDDDETVRRAVKMSDESLKFTTYSDRKNATKNILDDDDVDNDNANDDTNDKSKDYTDSNVNEENSADEQKKPDGDAQKNPDGVDDQNLDNIEDVTFAKELKENEKEIEDEFDHVLENILKAGLELNQ